ncbi:factor-independent urate hydroxylase [Nocardioides sp. Kera G14]|uniref:factor-independent urate hydroxylase n=1 Tax=Nocardioides sp. Kera G14 TaxID=2884264 RepID=UPI001D105C4F|nr:urate oxidase [Nocardioides sp. Kera G14]UDY22856.1 urate oxidase [Nocardioides sp. Kera G14]
MSIRVGENQYGKAEVRLVKVDRPAGYPSADEAGQVHTVHDLNVTTQLRGDFDSAFTEGDNSHVHATDTQKNTVYAKAREWGVTSAESFLLQLASYWNEQPHVDSTWFKAEEFTWERIGAGTLGEGHSFARVGQETRTAVVQTYGSERFVVGGLQDLIVMKSTGSEFHGFPRDQYTALGETDDRIMATSVTAWWRFTPAAVEDPATDWDGLYDRIKALLLDTFAGVHSFALQQTIFEMGRAVLEQVPEVAEFKISCPNKHHFVVDLSGFGLDNPGEVFHASDRYYGLIQTTVVNDEHTPEPRAWAGIPSFA